jgi:two-component system, chemotaxis family, protein-glutamate methylesterase/glutaminase
MTRIAVVGASQGGVRALREVVSGLPADFPATVFIVQHTGAANSVLPSLLSEVAKLPVAHARDRESIHPGHIYVAPPDHHMLLVDGHLELTRGPRENWARPAIDPLFRTAAESYARDVTGIVLTGLLNDGTAGLYEIKRRGGTSIVQDPDEAEADSMPRSAIDNVAVDYCLPLAEIPILLTKLARTEGRQPSGVKPSGALVMPEGKIDRPVAQTCPECGGAMREDSLGTLTRFRCHTGHMMTAEVLAAAQVENLDRNIAATFRGLNERAAFCADIADKREASGDRQSAEIWRRASEEAATREDLIRKVAQADWIHPESIEKAA